MSNALLNLALRNASLCGPFDPLDFCEDLGLAEANEQTRDHVLQGLSRCSAERILHGADDHPSRYCWILHPDARRRALSGLVSPQMIDVALETAPPPLPQDQLGPLLRSVLRCKLPRAPRRDEKNGRELLLYRQMSHWGAVFDALQFARDVPAADLDWIAKQLDSAAIKIKALQRDRDTQIVLPTVRTKNASRSISLFGREHYRERLSTHLLGRGEDPRPVLMTAVGGAGKSALLASLINSWNTRRGSKHVTVLLDFDRRQLVTGEPIQMLQEFLRQLDWGLTHLDVIPRLSVATVRAFLRALRADMPNLLATGGTRDFGSQLGFLHSSIFPRLQNEAADPLRDLSIALIMDSFEAIDRQGGVAVRRLMDVEAALREFGLSGLRTVVSGRAPPLPEPELSKFFGPDNRRVRIGGIGKVSGGRLLKEHDTAGVFRRVAEREAASEALGGHPLALIVLGQYAATHTGDAKALIKDITSDEGFRAEFAQVYLYERILQRIDDNEVRELAHPGLVLRQLNADIVRLVLAKPCFEEEIDSDEAQELIERLAEEYWLTENGEGAFPIRHRPDLRRLMLPGLFAGPRERDTAKDAARKTQLAKKAREVCDAMAVFFTNEPPATDPAHRWWRAIPAADREVEATYYRALGNDLTPWFDRDFANRLFLVLGQDLETLPPSWVSRTKALRGEMLEDTEWDALPEDTREAAADVAFQTSIRQGGFDPANLKLDISELSKSLRVKSSPDVRTLRSKASETAPLDDVPLSRIADKGLLNFSTDLGKSSPGVEASPEIVRRATPKAMSREIAAHFLIADFAAIAEMTPTYLSVARDAGMEFADGDGLFLSPVWQTVLVASILSGDASDNGPLPMTDPEDGPIHNLVLAVRAIWAHSDAPSDTETTKVPSDELRNLLQASDGRISVEQLPLRSLRYHAPDVSELLTHPDIDQTRDIRLGTRALALAACDAAPSGDPSEISGLPGNLPMLIAPLYAPDAMVDLALIQTLYRKSEPFLANAQEITALTGISRGVFARMVRGLSPDLYGPTRHVLAEQGADVALQCVEHLAATSPNWPKDLCFQNPSDYREVQAATIVETADQCGVFSDLLDQLAGMDPRARQLAAMHAALGAWFFQFDESMTC